MTFGNICGIFNTQKNKEYKPMNVGDLVKLISTVEFKNRHHQTIGPTIIAMIIEGPNEVGKIKLLLPCGSTRWSHSTEVEYMPKKMEYLKE